MNDGTILFTTDAKAVSGAHGPTEQGIFLVDLVDAFFRACRAARHAISVISPVGRIKVGAQLAAEHEKILNLSTRPDRATLALSADTLRPENYRTPIAYAEAVVDESELVQPCDLVARLFVQMLRTLRGADVRLSSFRDSMST